MERSQSSMRGLLLSELWQESGKGTYPWMSLMIFSHTEEESLPLSGCCQIFLLSDEVTSGKLLGVTALLFPWLWLKSWREEDNKAIWEVYKINRKQNLSGLQECITGFSHRWEACWWVVFRCRFALSLNLHRIPERSASSPVERIAVMGVLRGFIHLHHHWVYSPSFPSYWEQRPWELKQ